jgi:Beta-propeller repeat
VYRESFIESLEDRIVLSGFPFGIGSTGIDYGTGMATDRSGNIYVSGTFQGKVDFDPSRHNAFLNAEGQGSAFVAKYDKNGNFIWAKKLGSQTQKIADVPVGVSGRIAVDPDGNVYTTGMFNATSDFEPSSGIFGDIDIVKLDTNGNTIWQKGIGGFGLEAGFGIALDSSNNVFVTGTYSLSVDFNPGGSSYTLTSKGLLDAFVAKYSTNGKFIWARGIGGDGADTGFAVAVSPTTGQSYVTGTMTSASAKFYDASGGGTTILDQSGTTGAFVVKLTAGGHLGFARTIAGSGKSFAEGFGIAVDPHNDIFFCGAFSGTVDFDPGSAVVDLTPVQATDGFLEKLSGGAGNFLIAKRVGGPDDNSLNDVKITPSGDVYVAGFYNAPHVSVSGAGQTGVASQGGAGQFIAKFRISGGFIKARGFGGGLDDWATALAINPVNNDIYFTGFVDAVTGNETDFQFVNIDKGGNASLYRIAPSLAPV